MASTFDKMNQLIQKLRHKPCTLEELSQLMGANPRTIFRFLGKLDADGLGLRKSVIHGRTLKYWLEPPSPLIPPRLLNQLRTMDSELAQGGNLRYRKNLQAIINHLDPARPKNQTVPVPIQIDPHFVLDHGPLAENQISDKMVGRLISAIETGEELKIVYNPSNLNNTQTLLFHPVKVVLRVGRLYLLGKPAEQNNPRIIPLAVRRIRNFTSTGKLFPTSPFDVSNYYRYCFGPWSPQEKTKPERIVLAIKEAWAETLLKESNFQPPLRWRSQQNSPIAELKLYLNPDLENWLLGLIPAVKVLEPQSLALRLRERMSKA